VNSLMRRNVIHEQMEPILQIRQEYVPQHMTKKLFNKVIKVAVQKHDGKRISMTNLKRRLQILSSARCKKFGEKILLRNNNLEKPLAVLLEKLEAGLKNFKKYTKCQDEDEALKWITKYDDIYVAFKEYLAAKFVEPGFLSQEYFDMVMRTSVRDNDYHTVLPCLQTAKDVNQRFGEAIVDKRLQKNGFCIYTTREDLENLLVYLKKITGCGDEAEVLRYIKKHQGNEEAAFKNIVSDKFVKTELVSQDYFDQVLKVAMRTKKFKKVLPQLQNLAKIRARFGEECFRNVPMKKLLADDVEKDMEDYFGYFMETIGSTDKAKALRLLKKQKGNFFAAIKNGLSERFVKTELISKEFFDGALKDVARTGTYSKLLSLFKMTVVWGESYFKKMLKHKEATYWNVEDLLTADLEWAKNKVRDYDEPTVVQLFKDHRHSRKRVLKAYNKLKGYPMEQDKPGHESMRVHYENIADNVKDFPNRFEKQRHKSLEEQDYYYILGLPENASNDNIKKTYRRLCMKYHVDKNPSDDRIEHSTMINAAYQKIMECEGDN